MHISLPVSFFNKWISISILFFLFASNSIRAESQIQAASQIPAESSIQVDSQTPTIESQNTGNTLAEHASALPQNAIQYPVLIFDSTNNPEFPNNFRTSYSPYSIITPDSPTRTGLDSLNISGSAQFSETNLKNILIFLRQYVAPKNIIIVDLRQESHGFLDNMPVSWYGENNAANQGKTAAEIKFSETSLLNNLKDQNLIKVGLRQKERERAAPESAKFLFYEINYHKALSEAKLLDKYAAKYKRFFVQDHHAPTAEQVDEFLNFIATLPKNTWLHFHCRAGIGRTTTFMAMLDILHNAHKVTLEGILKRQALIGGMDLLDTKRGGETSDLKQKRREFITLFYRYASDAEGYPKKTWSEWINGNSTNSNSK